MSIGSSIPRLTGPALVFAAIALLAVWALPGRSQSPSAQLLALDARKPISSLPFTIDRCGSYFVTRCLTGQSGSNGITIAADDVTLDLNGFTLTGVPGSQTGIAVTAPGSVTITNGHVRNWGAHGVSATLTTTTLTVAGVSASGNGDAGINLGRGLVDGCTLTGNTFGGISAGGTGIGAVLIRNCRAEGGAFGFSLTGSADAQGCSAEGCAVGFRVADGVTLRACVVLDNACGIRLDASGATVRECSVVENDIGIHVPGTSGNRIEANALASNDCGILVDGGSTDNLIVGNTALGPGTGYLIGPGNPHGPIVNVSGVGDLSGATGADHPRANLEY